MGFDPSIVSQTGRFLVRVIRDCAIIIWRGGSKINRGAGGPELKPKRRVGG